MGKHWKWLAIGSLVIIFAVWLFRNETNEVALTTVLADIGKGQIEQIVLDVDGSAKAKYMDRQGKNAWVTFHIQPGMDLFESGVTSRALRLENHDVTKAKNR